MILFLFCLLCKWYRHSIIYFPLFSASIHRSVRVSQTKQKLAASAARKMPSVRHTFLGSIHYPLAIIIFHSNRYENICMIFIASNLRPPLSLIGGRSAKTLSSPSAERKRSIESPRYALDASRRVADSQLDLSMSLSRIQIRAPLTAPLKATRCPHESTTSCHWKAISHNAGLF